MQCLRKKTVMRVLLSIKPEFVNKIFSGEKRYEFRKVIFRNKGIKTVVIYASSPVSKIVGEFTIDTIIKDSPEVIWGQTKDYAGITEDFFKQYFKGKNKAYAIKVKRSIQYQKPVELSEIGIKCAPQSFMYLEKKRSGEKYEIAK